MRNVATSIFYLKLFARIYEEAPILSFSLSSRHPCLLFIHTSISLLYFSILSAPLSSFSLFHAAYKHQAHARNHPLLSCGFVFLFLVSPLADLSIAHKLVIYPLLVLRLDSFSNERSAPIFFTFARSRKSSLLWSWMRQYANASTHNLRCTEDQTEPPSSRGNPIWRVEKLEAKYTVFSTLTSELMNDINESQHEQSGSHGLLAVNEITRRRDDIYPLALELRLSSSFFFFLFRPNRGQIFWHEKEPWLQLAC